MYDQKVLCVQNHEKNCNYFKWVDDEDDGTSDVTSNNAMNEEHLKLVKEISLQYEAVMGEVKLLKEVVVKNQVKVESMFRGCVLGIFLYCLWGS